MPEIVILRNYRGHTLAIFQANKKAIIPLSMTIPHLPINKTSPNKKNNYKKI